MMTQALAELGARAGMVPGAWERTRTGTGDQSHPSTNGTAALQGLQHASYGKDHIGLSNDMHRPKWLFLICKQLMIAPGVLLHQ